ncbi:MAG: superoxide dismutase [Patescibacteria group bacterium]|jgi:Fe-Mn family superoxide dismutase
MDETKKHKIIDLPYAYSALEPYIDEETMHFHHDKHHQTYADKFNSALEKHPELLEKQVEDLLKNIEQLPEDIGLAVRNHGGGFYNHNLFWAMMASEGEGGHPEGKLLEAIERDFGNFEKFREEFTSTALNHFGSGWAWLVKGVDGKLKVYSLSNQDTPIGAGDRPLLTLDVWEHAYYLKYKNKRADFIEAWWNIVNWNEVARRFEEN